MLIQQSTLQPFLYSLIHLGDGERHLIRTRVGRLDDYSNRPPVLSPAAPYNRERESHLHLSISQVKCFRLLKKRVVNGIMFHYVNLDTSTQTVSLHKKVKISKSLLPEMMIVAKLHFIDPNRSLLC
jgi:hypothetical protein